MPASQAIIDQLDDVLRGTPYHVYPVGEAHFTDGEPCWCEPEVEREPGCAPIVVHKQQIA